MNELDTPLYVKIKTASHIKLKTYSALNNESMRQTIENWIESLAFNE